MDVFFSTGVEKSIEMFRRTRNLIWLDDDTTPLEVGYIFLFLFFFIVHIGHIIITIF